MVKMLKVKGTSFVDVFWNMGWKKWARVKAIDGNICIVDCVEEPPTHVWEQVQNYFLEK